VRREGAQAPVPTRVRNETPTRNGAPNPQASIVTRNPKPLVIARRVALWQTIATLWRKRASVCGVSAFSPKRRKGALPFARACPCEFLILAVIKLRPDQQAAQCAQGKHAEG
jgi:hypothetical protein